MCAATMPCKNSTSSSSRFSNSTISGFEIVRQLAVGVVDKGHTTGHAGREVAPGTAQDDNLAAGHVFRSHDRRRPRQRRELRSCGPRTRSPTTPRKKTSPLVAPNRMTLPPMMFSSAT